jgi:N-acetylglucosamine kinase-like BadF-type ATPase
VSQPARDEPAVLAFDGGSTKTDAVLVSSSGRVLGRARVGPSNHQQFGVDGAFAALAEAVEAVSTAAGVDGRRLPLAPVGVYCLAGVDLPIDEETLQPCIDERGWTARSILLNDTFAVMRAGATVPWGIGVACGTGLNCAGIAPDGQMVRFPALEELSGDFAPGGAWLGVRALGLALRAADGRGGPTRLRETIPAHFDVPDVETVLHQVYTGAIARHRLFALAKVLLDAAADGDAESRRAADVLADEVVAFVRGAVRRLRLEDAAVEVVLGGGIFQTRDLAFHQRVGDGILAVAPGAQMRSLNAPPVLGAALIGLALADAPASSAETLREALRVGVLPP